MPARKKRKTAATQERRHGKKGEPPFPPSFYIMTLEAMEACNFPLPQVGPDGEMSCPEGFTATQPSTPAEAGIFMSNHTSMCLPPYLPPPPPPSPRPGRRETKRSGRPVSQREDANHRGILMYRRFQGNSLSRSGNAQGLALEWLSLAY